MEKVVVVVVVVKEAAFALEEVVVLDEHRCTQRGESGGRRGHLKRL